MNTKFLEQKLAERGMTPADLASKVGLSVSYTKLMLRGLTPARHTLRLLALVLGCDVRELLDENSAPDGAA